MKWEKEWDDVFEYGNSGNDHFFEWYDLREGGTLVHLIEEWIIGECCPDVKVNVKVKKGAILITARKGK